MQVQQLLASEFFRSLTLIASLTVQTSPITTPCVLYQLIADFHTFTPTKAPRCHAPDLARARGAEGVTTLAPFCVYADACVSASYGAALGLLGQSRVPLGPLGQASNALSETMEYSKQGSLR